MRPSNSKTSRMATAGMGLALLAAALMIGGYLAVSSAVLDIEVGFRLFLGGVALSLIALAVSLIGMRLTRITAGHAQWRVSLFPCL